jgi:hypothetical protein
MVDDGLVVSDSIVGVGMGGVGVGLVTGRPVGVGVVVEPGGVGCAETALGVVRPGPSSNATGGSNIPWKSIMQVAHAGSNPLT